MPCSRHPLSKTIRRFFSGVRIIANGIGPTSYEAPAGSSCAPVGRRLTPEGSCAAIAAAARGEGELQPATATAAKIKRPFVGDTRRKMALTVDSASLILRE